MAKNRNRGVCLDKEKVRAQAVSIGIQTPTIFEIQFVKHFDLPEEKNVTAPKKAWNGQKMDKSYAMKIAELLGLGDYSSLLPDQTTSPWKNLIENKKNRSLFMRMRLIGDADKNLIDTKILRSEPDDEYSEISMKRDWYLELKGSYGDNFLVILQSHEYKFQLAPLNIEGFTSKMPKRMKELRYPSKKSFSFGKEYGLGWRCCTVIRAATIPIAPKTLDSSLALSDQKLDEFALRLMQSNNQPISIAQYEFMLVE